MFSSGGSHQKSEKTTDFSSGLQKILAVFSRTLKEFVKYDKFAEIFLCISAVALPSEGVD